MIPHKVEREVHVGGTGKTQAFTLTMSPHMASLLSDKLYSDKVTAVIREYCCNARDSNVQAGNTAPIHVHLPTLVEPWFSVKDQGVGLTFSEIGTLFCTYGASTKQGDNQTTGMFGVGSKAWAAYSDQMTVTATKNGVTERASCFKDSDGMPTMAKIGETTLTPDEPNGVTVQIPVGWSDFSEFQRKARKVLEFFSPQPTFNVKDFKTGNEDASPPLLKGDVWELRNANEDTSIVVTGQVPYRVDRSRLGEDFYPFNLVVRVPLGSVDIAASREELSFNAQTTKFLSEYMKKICEEITLKIKDTFDSSSLWDKSIFRSRYLPSWVSHETAIPTLIQKLSADYVELKWAAKVKYDEVSACLLDNHILRRERVPLGFGRTIDFASPVFRGGKISILLLPSDQENVVARVKAAHRELCNTAGYLLMRYPPGEVDLVKELLGSPPDDIFLDLSKYTDDDLGTVGVSLVKKARKRSLPAYLMRFTPQTIRYRSLEKSQFVPVTEGEVPPSGYYITVKDNRIDHPKLGMSDASTAVSFLTRGMFTKFDSPIFAIHSHRVNWFATQKGWINLADEFDRWCSNLLDNPTYLRKFIMENDPPPLASLETELTKLVKYGIIGHECDKMLVSYYHHLKHIGGNRRKNCLMTSLYTPEALRCRIGQIQKDRDARYSTWSLTCREKVVKKYPLLALVYNQRMPSKELEESRNTHITKYMEKINEQCTHHNA